MPYEVHDCLRSHRGADLTGKLRVWLSPVFNIKRAFIYDYDPDDPVMTWGADALLATSRTAGGSGATKIVSKILSVASMLVQREDVAASVSIEEV